jgi:hypothetical protein
MEQKPAYPLIVLEDDGSVVVFDALAEAEGWMEAIDVENGEYQAWDGRARPVHLAVADRAALGIGCWEMLQQLLRGKLGRVAAALGQEPHWLAVTLLSEEADAKASEVIGTYLRQVGVAAGQDASFDQVVSMVRVNQGRA